MLEVLYLDKIKINANQVLFFWGGGGGNISIVISLLLYSTRYFAVSPPAATLFCCLAFPFAVLLRRIMIINWGSRRPGHLPCTVHVLGDLFCIKVILRSQPSSRTHGTHTRTTQNVSKLR